MKSAPTLQAGSNAGTPALAGKSKNESTPSQPGARSALSSREAGIILIALMFPGMLMPLASSMSRVALPVIRDVFAISADMTAWVDTAFTLPFMVLMPVYGRLSDGVGRRRLIMAGILIFTIGSAMTLAATSLVWIMVGRAVQGFGVAGMMPLGMAFLTTIFQREERGKALGTWSSIGPVTGLLAPLAAGFLVEDLGWRASFGPPVVVGIVALWVVWRYVPAGFSTVRPNFLRRFDWPGVTLLTGAATSFLFFVSSRPITGVAPLRDWRLLTVTGILLASFLWWEQRRADPFVPLSIFRNRLFTVASLSASMRMMTMAGSGFLLPLYLVDIHHFGPRVVGMMLMISPGFMALMVRFGGQSADQWGSRLPVTLGFLAQISTMVLYSLLPESATLWSIGGLQALYGLGVGIMLAALHRAAIGQVPEEQIGAAAGFYSMIRFAGMTVGGALAGVILQSFLDASLLPVQAYQYAYLCFAGASLVGLVITLWMKE